MIPHECYGSPVSVMFARKPPDTARGDVTKVILDSQAEFLRLLARLIARRWIGVCASRPVASADRQHRETDVGDPNT